MTEATGSFHFNCDDASELLLTKYLLHRIHHFEDARILDEVGNELSIFLTVEDSLVLHLPEEL